MGFWRPSFLYSPSKDLDTFRWKTRFEERILFPISPIDHLLKPRAEFSRVSLIVWHSLLQQKIRGKKNLPPAAVNYGVRSSGLVFEGLHGEREPAADHRLLHHQVVATDATCRNHPKNSALTPQELTNYRFFQPFEIFLILYSAWTILFRHLHRQKKFKCSIDLHSWRQKANLKLYVLCVLRKYALGRFSKYFQQDF